MAAISQIFFRPAVWLAVLLPFAVLLWIAWRSHIKWWPAWMLRVGLVWVVWLGLFSSQQNSDVPDPVQRSVMLVDVSDSISGDVRNQTMQSAQEWQTEGENRVLIMYGSQLAVVLPGSDPLNSASISKIDTRSSNLAGALQLAENQLGGSPGKIIVASDGLVFPPELVDEIVADLIEEKNQMDIIPLPSRPMANDLAVGRLTVPSILWAGTAFDLLVPVYGIGIVHNVELELIIDGKKMDYLAEPVGTNLYQFHIPGLREGIATLEVDAEYSADASDAGQPVLDPFPANNSSFATLQVFPPPNVLFVTLEPNSGDVRRVRRLLDQNGVNVEMVTPDKLPTNLEVLQNYGVIFIDNLLSSHISPEQMVGLEVFVSKIGGGVVFLGGQNSYTLGGYKETPIEPMLPVKLEPPPRSLRQPIVFLLTLDLSSSMEKRNEDEVSSMALAREAALRSIETLRIEDHLGVLTFSDTFNWRFPISLLGSPEGIQQAMDTVSLVEASGTTMMYEAMQEGVNAMAALPADAPESRHILVLSDGQSTDGTLEQFLDLAGMAHTAGIKLSTIALGEDADIPLMERMAEVGEGRFYFVKDAEDLPNILISESLAARSENTQLGLSGMKLGESGHPLMSGLNQQQLPTLYGYNALRSKTEEGAEDILVSQAFDDPILSAWQYGLGRVVAWTTDIGEEWLGSWPAESEGRFWSQVVRYALADPSLKPAQVNIQTDGSQMEIQASIFTSDGDPLNLSELKFTYIDLANQPHSFLLAQQSAGIYHAETDSPPEGAYRAIVNYLDERKEATEIAAPFVVNPPAEWLPQDPKTGRLNLEKWVAASGGKMTTFEEIRIQNAASQEEQPDLEIEWWWYLFLALIVLWPLEIAIRRRWLPWM